MKKNNNPSKSVNLRSGFTLLEVLLVSVLLFFLALTTFSAVRSTFRTKTAIDERSSRLQPARAVLGILERELRNAFFYTPEDLIWFPTRPRRPNEDVAPPPPPRPAVVTIFKGKKNEVFFTSNMHQRSSANVPQNEQSFVTYQLVGDELVRAESSRAVAAWDREDESKFRKLTVLENIKRFELSYYDSKKGDWVEQWDSESVDQKDRLPEAVEVSLEYTPEENTTAPSRTGSNTVLLKTTIALLQAALQRGNPTAPVAGLNPQTPDTGGAPLQ